MARRVLLARCALLLCIHVAIVDFTDRSAWTQLAASHWLSTLCVVEQRWSRVDNGGRHGILPFCVFMSPFVVGGLFVFVWRSHYARLLTRIWSEPNLKNGPTGDIMRPNTGQSREAALLIMNLASWKDWNQSLQMRDDHIIEVELYVVINLHSARGRSLINVLIKCQFRLLLSKGVNN